MAASDRPSPAAALDCQRFGHEDEGGHCGHCGAQTRMRQPLTNNGRILPEPYMPTPGEFWVVAAGLSLLCMVTLAIGIATSWWPAYLAAIVCGLLVVLGIVRLVADMVNGGGR